MLEYQGQYVVTPKAEQKTILQTKQYLLTENVLVIKIPYFETSNTSGGTTVYIAEGG